MQLHPVSCPVSVLPGRQQPADCAESWAAGCGAAGAAGPAQSRFSGGSDPPAGLEGRASRLGHAAAGAPEAGGALQPAGRPDGADAHTGILR